MYLLIFSDGDSTVEKDFDTNWIGNDELQVFKYKNNAFYELDINGNWILVI
jgi:hypothetical protein